MTPDTCICAFANALHRSGAPAHELEALLAQLGTQLGVQVQSFCLPTAITLTIAPEEEGSSPRIYMLRLPTSDYNMARLMKLMQLTKEVGRSASPLDAQRALQVIMAEPLAWGVPASLVAAAVFSASVALLFGGAWTELWCSAWLGLVLAGVHRVLARWSRLAPILPFILCALAAILAHALALCWPQQKVFITMIAAIVVMAPGFTITVALAELATMNLLSGAGRLAGGAILLLLMAFGVAFGAHVSQAIFPVVALGTGALPPVWVVWPAVAVLGCAIMAVVQAPMRTMVVGAMAAVLAYGVVALLQAPLGAVGAGFGSAFLVTLCANLYQRVSGQPAMLLQVPGLLTLVPGSVGFRGLHALMERNSIVGINTMTDMVVTATALVVGVLMASALAPVSHKPAR